jgi:hypothetical protein
MDVSPCRPAAPSMSSQVNRIWYQVASSAGISTARIVVCTSRVPSSHETPIPSVTVVARGEAVFPGVNRPSVLFSVKLNVPGAASENWSGRP